MMEVKKTMTIKNKPLHSEWWHKTVIQKLKNGESNRKVARDVFGNDSYESRIRTFLSRDDVKFMLGEEENLNKENIKILYWDLESSLLEGQFFRLWKENIPFNRITKQTHLLSHSYSFNNDKVIGSRLTPEQVKTGDDFDLVVNMIEAISKADVMVTFNGKKFDVKLLNTRALFWGLPPISYPKHIDLFEQAKRVFKFPSNSMQNVSKYLGLDGKIATCGTQLWERCANWENYNQCNNALEEMMVYGNQDIEATRDLFNRMKGWMKNIPNIGNIVNEVSGNKTLRCIHCGHDDIFPIESKTYTATSIFDLYRCSNDTCRGVSRVTKNGNNLVGVV